MGESYTLFRTTWMPRDVDVADYCVVDAYASFPNLKMLIDAFGVTT